MRWHDCEFDSHHGDPPPLIGKGRGPILGEIISIQLVSNENEVLMKNAVTSAIPPYTIVIASIRVKTHRA